MPKRLTDEEREASQQRQKELAKLRGQKWRENNRGKAREASLKWYYKSKDVETYIQKHERLIKLIAGKV